MAYEFLKKLFGTQADGEEPRSMTYEELEAAINADKGISLVNLKDGGYVSKDKFDAKVTELEGVQGQLNTANETIKGFEGQDIEGIKQKVSEWETKYDTDTKKLKDQLAAQQRSHAEDMFMAGYQFTSKAAKNGVLAELRAKEFKLGDNNELLGAKEFMTSLMENDDYKGAFKIEDPSGGDGNPDGSGSNGTQNHPRFSSGTNGGVGTNGGSDAPKFNFGFTHIREPENK